MFEDARQDYELVLAKVVLGDFQVRSLVVDLQAAAGRKALSLPRHCPHPANVTDHLYQVF